MTDETFDSVVDRGFAPLPGLPALVDAPPTEPTDAGDLAAEIQVEETQVEPPAKPKPAPKPRTPRAKKPASS